MKSITPNAGSPLFRSLGLAYTAAVLAILVVVVFPQPGWVDTFAGGGTLGFE